MREASERLDLETTPVPVWFARTYETGRGTLLRRAGIRAPHGANFRSRRRPHVCFAEILRASHPASQQLAIHRRAG
jgi:hypothetical protein